MIRDATEADAVAIAEIYNYYIKNTVVTFEETELDAAEIIARLNKIQDSGFSWLVAIDKEQIIGYAYATKWHERAAYRHTAEVTVYLSHFATSKGWGTELYKSLFSRLQDRGIHAVIGGITLSNPASIALDERTRILLSLRGRASIRRTSSRIQETCRENIEMEVCAGRWCISF